MKFSALLALAPLAAHVAADNDDTTSSYHSLTYGETWTTTVAVNQNGHVYTKTRVEVYTGQATTDPTSGTVTTVFTISNSDATYTKTVVATYSKTSSTSTNSESTSENTSDYITTTITYTQQYQTYTKTLTGDSTDFESTEADGAVGRYAGLFGAFVAGVGLFL